LKLTLQSCLRLLPALMLFTCLSGGIPCLHAQSDQTTRISKAEKIDAPETDSQLEAFRHSPAVQSLARHAHISIEAMAQILEDLNSAILIIAILWFIFRFVPKMYRERSEALSKRLFDARSATVEANARLAAVEERLSKLGIEIEAIHQQTLRDGENDEKRIHESLEAEQQRILASVNQEIEAAGASARRDLKKYAASLAIERAMSEVHFTDDDDRALIRSFAQNVSTNHRGGQN
jgi:F-type H+-transporting ATPase subunit b